MRLSPPRQVTIILTNLLQHTQSAKTEEEQLTYFLAFVDCLPWVEADAIEFWLNQIVFAAEGLRGSSRDTFVKRIWECISGDMGGDSGLKAVEWWVNGGRTDVSNPKL